MPVTSIFSFSNSFLTFKNKSKSKCIKFVICKRCQTRLLENIVVWQLDIRIVLNPYPASGAIQGHHGPLVLKEEFTDGRTHNGRSAMTIAG